jgi:hypothetical protein
MASRSHCFARSNVSWPCGHNIRHVQDAVNFLGRRLHLGIVERPTSRQFLVSFVCSRLCLGMSHPCCRTQSTFALPLFARCSMDVARIKESHFSSLKYSHWLRPAVSPPGTLLASGSKYIFGMTVSVTSGKLVFALLVFHYAASWT